MSANPKPAMGPALPRRYSTVLDKQAEIWRWITRTPSGTRRIDELARYLGSQSAPTMPYGEDELREKLADGLFNQYGSMLTATPYFVSSEVCELLEVASKTIEEWRNAFDLFPTMAGFVWLERPLAVFDETSEERTELQAIAWDRCTTSESSTPHIRTYPADKAPGPEEIPAIALTFFASLARSTTRTPQPTGIMVYRDGSEVYRQRDSRTNQLIEEPQSMRTKLNYLGALLFFMRQRLVVENKAPADRATRRRNMIGNAEPQPISILQLRSKRYVRTKASSEGAEERAKIEHQYRWMVGNLKGGFWNTYHVGTGRQREEQRWILPFIVGPADKPLKMPDKILIEVTR